VSAPAVVIRKATEADVPGIVELWKEFVDFHAVRDPYFTRSASGHENFAKYVAERMRKESDIVLVAEAAGCLVGFCVAGIVQRPPVYEISECGGIDSLAVTEGYRRRGVGNRLVEEARRWFIGRGVRRIEVGVLMENRTAGSFWRKMGFRPYFEKMYLDLDAPVSDRS
jgi:ribosomal protein S18 acetylase RimI-like enzyme